MRVFLCNKNIRILVVFDVIHLIYDVLCLYVYCIVFVYTMYIQIL